MTVEEQAAVLVDLAERIKQSGAGELIRLAKAAAECRREPLYEGLADFCRAYGNAYENVNYDAKTNGEGRVLSRILGKVALEKGTCVFDVGANVGGWTILAHEACLEGVIHCFEIAPPTYERLATNVGNLPHVFLNAFGLGAKEGEIPIRYFPTNPGGTTATGFPSKHPALSIKSKVITGDQYMEEHKIEKIDYLKIDVEGMEMEVMFGFKKAITTGRVNCIQFEYGEVNILTKVLLIDFYRNLIPSGYMIGKIYPNYVDFRDYQPSREDFRGPNFLAVRRERADLIELAK